jgi:tetratricopeptide repeat protein
MRLHVTRFNGRLPRVPAQRWILSIVILLAHVGSNADVAGPPAKVGNPSTLFLNTEPGVRYVGSAACSQCHADITTRYIATKMGRSVTLARGPQFLKLVPQRVTLYNRKLDRYFQVFAEGKKLYQAEYQLGPEGKEIFRNTQPLAYAIGAGMAGYGFLVQQGDYLFEAPLSYYSLTRSWEFSPGYQTVDFGFNRPIGRACIACHSGRPQPVKGREGRFNNPPFLEMAVGCENCHGPGELHVKQRLAGAPPQGPVDPTIVNPAHLSGWLADNICMNCHQSGDARVESGSGSSIEFRPGLVLDDSAAIFALPFTRKSPPSSPLLQHYFLMIMSKCHRASGGRMSCITCHDPHIEPTREAAPAYFRKKCMTCHTDASCGLPLAARMKKRPADDCAGCHMPKQNLTMISHSSLTNHRIIARAGEPFPEEAFHLADAEETGLVHISAMPGKKHVPVPRLILLDAYGQLVDSHPEFRPPFNTLLHQVSKTKPVNVELAEQLAHRAILENTTRSLEEAAGYLKKAIEIGSDSADDYEMLAQILSRSGEDAEAIEVLKRALEIDPYRARIYQNLTMLLVKSHQYTEALAVMKKELEIFPQDSTMRDLIRQAEGGPPVP